MNEQVTQVDAQGAGAAGSRRVLMLCYFFPPIHSVGANRSVGFVTHLPSFGWRPTVLSVTRTRIPWERTGAAVPSGVEIVRAPEYNLQRVSTLFDVVTNRVFRTFGAKAAPRSLELTSWVPDTQIAWRSGPVAMRLAREVDCLYVSCSPFSAAITAARVAERTGKPLVLDFRDPWQGIGRQLRYERWAIERASALILNTPYAMADYVERLPDQASKMLSIPNGFDTDAATGPRPPRDGLFTIMHVGEFYGTRQPDTLLDVLAELNLPDVEFVQVGEPPAALERYRSRVRIRHIPTLPRAEAVAMMNTASLLYLRLHSENVGTLAVPAKTYEYLASGVPILAEAHEAGACDLIHEYGLDAEIVQPDERVALRAALERMYARRHQPSGGVHPVFAARYNRRAQTGRLAAVFDNVLAGRTPGSGAAA